MPSGDQYEQKCTLADNDRSETVEIRLQETSCEVAITISDKVESSEKKTVREVKRSNTHRRTLSSGDSTRVLGDTPTKPKSEDNRKLSFLTKLRRFLSQRRKFFTNKRKASYAFVNEKSEESFEKKGLTLWPFTNGAKQSRQRQWFKNRMLYHFRPTDKPMNTAYSCTLSSLGASSRTQMYRFVTGVQIAFSATSLLIVCLTLPVLYNHVQTTIDYVEKEMAFCERSNEEALVELEYGKLTLNGSRVARSAYGLGALMRRQKMRSYGDDVTGSPLETECPGCCIPGPPGPRGAAGTPGKPGNPGVAGKPGHPGTTPNQTCPILTNREPPPCRPCPKGPPGIKGWPGFPGDPGPMGAHGLKGNDGEDGTPGETGPVGPPGYKGGPGAPGDKGPTPEGELKEGPPGDSGPPGPIGAPGMPGMPGRNGLTGPQGDRGWPGTSGESGEGGYPGPEGTVGGMGPPGEPGVCVCQNVDSIIMVNPGIQPRIQDDYLQSGLYSGGQSQGYGRK